MRVITDVLAMQRQARRWQREGRRIGFVPTMGYLHQGHLSLVTEARRRAGRTGSVVVSIFVNPTQFAPHEDLAAYPRDLARDRALCGKAGVDVLFVPTAAAVYPASSGNAYSTYVVEEHLTRGMEGAARPTHFRGVTTVVAKLFNLVLPDVAVFGAKDWQQAMVVRRMARDLDFPVDVVVAPTVREADGLALSSRNKYLDPDERRQATVLWRAIQRVQEQVRAARRPLPATTLKRLVAALIAGERSAHLDYVEFFEPESLQPVRRVGPGAHLALAVFVGKTRLIDNARLA